MFRASAAPSAIEDAVNKATDENLTSENWEYILAVCDKVNDHPDNGPQEAVAALQKRLTHRSANVQLYSLTLTDSLAQNCGTKMHRELASRAFTQTLVRISSDHTVHHTVKARLLEVMEELVKLFSGDHSLGIMADALNQVKSLNPRLHAPDKPERPAPRRQETTEDEELKMVLALSLEESKRQEEERRKAEEDQARPTASSSTAAPSSAANGVDAAPAAPDPTATISRVRALYDLAATEPGELSFKKGDVIFVLEAVYHDWWKGSLRGEVGIFPLNYVTPIPDPTAREIQQEAEEEAQVFAEARNVERLLALLSNPQSSESADSEELQNLYRQSISIRPKLIKLIDRYAQQKDELIELNERFSTALHKYDMMMESYVEQYRSPAGINRVPSMPLSRPLQQPQPTVAAGTMPGMAPYANSHMPSYAPTSSTPSVPPSSNPSYPSVLPPSVPPSTNGASSYPLVPQSTGGSAYPSVPQSSPYPAAPYTQTTGFAPAPTSTNYTSATSSNAPFFYN
ncbi:class E vacuolar protein-sorting machinery protein hse1 [Myxozyma melibiosi]|uniref:Class E vacuolar protein-sorting machinery protein HSE1 n=1 Tax=Myxozyma melibiosi TaxID=54550 RepID=A0ABR1F4F7_9ASCO